jgi:hypothetical protein
VKEAKTKEEVRHLASGCIAPAQTTHLRRVGVSITQVSVSRGTSGSRGLIELVKEARPVKEVKEVRHLGAEW